MPHPTIDAGFAALMFIALMVAIDLRDARALVSDRDQTPRVVGGVRAHHVAKGDSLRSLAARAGVDYRTLAALNGLAANAELRVDRTLTIDNRHIVPATAQRATVVVNVPQRLLFYTAGGVTTALPVAVGKASWRTPLGAFAIIEKRERPTWHVPPSIREEARRAGKSLPLSVPPGPANPLGEFWLRLSIGGVGIHGTNAPSSVYQPATHGCIRLHPDDIAWLFPRVVVGTIGEVIYERVLLTTDAASGDVLLEVHPDFYRRDTERPLALVRALAESAGVIDAIDWIAVDTALARAAGTPQAIARLRIAAVPR